MFKNRLSNNKVGNTVYLSTVTVVYYTVVIFVDESCPKDLTELMELCADQAEGISCIL